MLTVIETPLFSKLWPAYWSEDERGTFAAFMAEHPDEGDVVPGSGGVRKVRWSRAGTGKSGGVRVIYFVRNDLGELVLLFMYAKSKLDSLKASTLKELRDAVK
nr:type II toxin-antitoxin system RelE/ParE family toxin [Rhodoferax sp.]